MAIRKNFKSLEEATDEHYKVLTKLESFQSEYRNLESEHITLQKTSIDRLKRDRDHKIEKADLLAELSIRESKIRRLETELKAALKALEEKQKQNKKEHLDKAPPFV